MAVAIEEALVVPPPEQRGARQQDDRHHRAHEARQGQLERAVKGDEGHEVAAGGGPAVAEEAGGSLDEQERLGPPPRRELEREDRRHHRPELEAEQAVEDAAVGPEEARGQQRLIEEAGRAQPIEGDGEEHQAQSHRRERTSPEPVRGGRRAGGLRGRGRA